MAATRPRPCSRVPDLSEVRRLRLERMESGSAQSALGLMVETLSRLQSGNSQLALRLDSALRQLYRRCTKKLGQSRDLACCLRQYHESSALGDYLFTGPRADVHLVVTARAFAHPAQGGGSSVGFARWHLLRERHPSYAALTYCRFRTFTLRIHGNLQASHNATERGLRGLVIGRKNHYGSRSRRGTEVAALLYSLVETAKLCGVEPKGYLRRAVTAALAGEQIPLPHEFAASARA